MMTSAIIADIAKEAKRIGEMSGEDRLVFVVESMERDQLAFRKIEDLKKKVKEARKATKSDESPWLPMETAPRDGTEVLMMTDCNGVVQSWWDPADDEDARSAGWVCANDAFDIGSDSSNLLGWMPLPTGTALMKSPDQVNA